MAVGPINTVGKDPVQPSDPESRRGAPNQDDAARLREILGKSPAGKVGEKELEDLAMALQKKTMEQHADAIGQEMDSRNKQLADHLKNIVQKMK